MSVFCKIKRGLRAVRVAATRAVGWPKNILEIPVINIIKVQLRSTFRLLAISNRSKGNFKKRLNNKGYPGG